MRRINLFTAVVLFLASCAATSYGVDPKPVPGLPDTYNFTVYFNVVTTDAHIDRDVEAQVANFKSKHGYTKHEVQNRDCNRFAGKCIVTVRFMR